MPDRIWLPIDRMSATAQQITNESGAFSEEAAWRLQSITNSIASLPAAMQGSLLDYLDAVRTAVDGLATLQHEIGDHLATAASASIVLDASVKGSFTEA